MLLHHCLTRVSFLRIINGPLEVSLHKLAFEFITRVWSVYMVQFSELFMVVTNRAIEFFAVLLVHQFGV
jgi:hypothetical protein